MPQAHPKPESETIADPTHGEEAVLGEDFRELVNPTDFQDGGKYRCKPSAFCSSAAEKLTHPDIAISKIQSRFRDQDGKDIWMMGTGWLIRNDLLVTAGHVVYDKAYGYGAASQIKCYIGYNGEDSVPKPSSLYLDVNFFDTADMTPRHSR